MSILDYLEEKLIAEKLPLNKAREYVKKGKENLETLPEEFKVAYDKMFGNKSRVQIGKIKVGIMVFFIKRAVKDLFSNRFLHAVTIITIALCVMIVSAFGLFFVNTSEILTSWKKGIRVMAYLNSDVHDDQLKDLKQKLFVMN